MNTVYRWKFSPATRRSVGTALLACAISWPGVTTYAESQPAPPPQQQQAQPSNKALLTQDELKDLVGPIALYPDALIALILPASTVPADVVLGARFVDSKGDPAQAGNQPWDDSVKSLAYYPDVLSWMNENLEWTSSLGEAFMDQPADVMNAIQALRAQAKASGVLTDTPQQQVITQQDTIRIIPADPEVIYVPQYDPGVVFVDTFDPGYTPYLTFGFGFAVGPWLGFDCDWGRRGIYRGDWIGWNRGGRRGGDVFINNTNVNVNVVNINSNNATRWNPSNRSMRQLALRQRNGGGNARFTRAEARQARDMIRNERRDNNGRLSANALAAARRDALPSPSRLQLREAAFNRTARNEAREGRQDNAAALAEARRNREDTTPNRLNAAERREMRRRTPTEAPRVSGQLEAPRQQQARAQERQNVRQQIEDRTVNRPNRLNRDAQAPTRAPRLDDSDRPSNRPSVSERQTERRQSMQNFRQERSEPRQSRSVDRPQRQERPSQPRIQRESRPQVNREPQRQQRSERQQPQRQQRQEVRQQRESRPQRQEARPQRRQENRSANRPQAQRQERPSKKSDGGGDRKKRD